MHRSILRYGGALLFAGVLALSGCAGDDGKNGATGPVGPAGPTGPQGPAGPAGQDGAPGQNGQDGADGQDLTATAKAESCSVCHADAGDRHQALYDDFEDGLVAATSNFKATIDSVVSTANGDGTFTSKMKFTLTQNGLPYIDADDAATTANETLSRLAQKTYNATQYDAATKTFTTATAFNYGTPKHLGNGQYEVVNATAKFAPEASASAMVYAYFGDTPIIPNPNPTRRYAMMDNEFSVAKVFGAIDFVSPVSSTNCEKCHPSPYPKHGYRMGAVVGLPDMVACKACHTDQREGTHADWQCLVDDVAAYAAGTCNTKPEWPAYAYVASTMNDTHMSHAMEFAYPQSMANCVTCHEGKLEATLANENFTLATCKSCHPVTGVGGTDSKRAPALKDLLTADGLGLIHTMDLYTFTGDCTLCHKAGGIGREFSKIHTGYDKLIYAADGTKYTDIFKTQIDSATFDSATNKLTVAFSATKTGGAAVTQTVANITPTVVISLYGYDTKDFIVGGHGSHADGKRNLEAVFGAAAHPRLTFTGGEGTWTVVADLSTWAGKLADGSVKRAEIGILPKLLLDPAVTTTPALAVGGVSKTFDLVAKAVVADADAYGKAIVDTAKCNACHDRLGVTFHNASYGSADVVGCRLCHIVGSGGSHLELQSRSIDSYIHAIHSMQPFDIGDVDFADPVEALHYEHHIESVYPKFTTLNCESCHNPGTYNVPDQSLSLPGVLSATDKVVGRNIGTVPSMVVGPATRACGSCHRSQMLNHDDAAGLAAFNAHTAANGMALENGTGVFDAAVAKIMSLFQ